MATRYERRHATVVHGTAQDWQVPAGKKWTVRQVIVKNTSSAAGKIGRMSIVNGSAFIVQDFLPGPDATIYEDARVVLYELEYLRLATFSSSGQSLNFTLVIIEVDL